MALVQPHAIAVHVAGAGQGLGHFQELFGSQHGADGRPPCEETHIVQSAERRGLSLSQGAYHFTYQGQVSADLLHGRAGLNLPDQFVAE